MKISYILKHNKIDINHLKLCLMYFDQLNATLVTIRNLFQKHHKILLTQT